MEYNPQDLIEVNARWHRPKEYETEHKLSRASHKLDRIIEFTNYPKSIIKFDNSNNRERGLHPTQKPVALFEYLIKTYTNPGELVLDNCMGAGTTAIACMNTQRNFIGFEMDKGYYDIAYKRIEAHKGETDGLPTEN